LGGTRANLTFPPLLGKFKSRAADTPSVCVFFPGRCVLAGRLFFQGRSLPEFRPSFYCSSLLGRLDFFFFRKRVLHDSVPAPHSRYPPFFPPEPVQSNTGPFSQELRVVLSRRLERRTLSCQSSLILGHALPPQGGWVYFGFGGASPPEVSQPQSTLNTQSSSSSHRLCFRFRLTKGKLRIGGLAHQSRRPFLEVRISFSSRFFLAPCCP